MPPFLPSVLNSPARAPPPPDNGPGPVPRSLRVAVIVASVGRPGQIAQMQRLMTAQSEPPDMLIFSVTSQHDLPEDLPQGPNLRVVLGALGLCTQRNVALDSLGDEFDLVVFYDDDFIPAPDSLSRIRTFFATHAEVAGATGHVLADGKNSSGIDYETATRLVRQHVGLGLNPNCIVTDLHGLYGCNMVYRTACIGTNRFDERLRLNGWQEDIDFAASLRGRGRIVLTFAFCGVHQGIKQGHLPCHRLGYSQVINPSYLVRKGTMPLSYALRLILCAVLTNHLRFCFPEPWINRRRRALGNWIGLLDLLRGRLTPERIENL